MESGTTAQTTAPAGLRKSAGSMRPVASVDIVIPVLNEERALAGCVTTLHAFLTESFPLDWRITIADNGSTDRTWAVATRLAAELDGVSVRRLDIRGRGAALRAAWRDSTADVVAYMDVDLSTGLEALLPLVAPLVSGHSDIMIGSRLMRGSRVRRGFKRELVSRCYNALLRLGFRTGFHDAQCGFKAARGTPSTCGQGRCSRRTTFSPQERSPRSPGCSPASTRPPRSPRWSART